jgi:hypothetical protein
MKPESVSLFPDHPSLLTSSACGEYTGYPAEIASACRTDDLHLVPVRIVDVDRPRRNDWMIP